MLRNSFYEELKKNKASRLYEALTEIYNYKKIIAEAKLYRDDSIEKILLTRTARQDLQSASNVLASEMTANIRRDVRFISDVAQREFTEALANSIRSRIIAVRREIEKVQQAVVDDAGKTLSIEDKKRDIQKLREEFETNINNDATQALQNRTIKGKPGIAPTLRPPSTVPGRALNPLPNPAAGTQLGQQTANILEDSKLLFNNIIERSPTELAIYLREVYKDIPFKQARIFTLMRDAGLTSNIGYKGAVEQWLNTELDSARKWYLSRGYNETEVTLYVQEIKEDFEIFLNNNSLLFNPKTNKDKKKALEVYNTALKDLEKLQKAEIRASGGAANASGGAASASGGAGGGVKSFKGWFFAVGGAVLASGLGYYFVRNIINQEKDEEIKLRVECKMLFRTATSSSEELMKCKKMREDDRTYYFNNNGKYRIEDKVGKENAEDYDLSFVFASNEPKIEGNTISKGDTITLIDGPPGKFTVSSVRIAKKKEVTGTTPWHERYQYLVGYTTARGTKEITADKVQIYQPASGYREGNNAVIRDNPEQGASYFATGNDRKNIKEMVKKCKNVEGVETDEKGDPVVEENPAYGGLKCKCENGSYSVTRSKAGGGQEEICPEQ